MKIYVIDTHQKPKRNKRTEGGGYGWGAHSGDSQLSTRGLARGRSVQFKPGALPSFLGDFGRLASLTCASGDRHLGYRRGMEGWKLIGQAAGSEGRFGRGAFFYRPLPWLEFLLSITVHPLAFPRPVPSLPPPPPPTGSVRLWGPTILRLRRKLNAEGHWKRQGIFRHLQPRGRGKHYLAQVFIVWVQDCFPGCLLDSRSCRHRFSFLIFP